ncbi:MAG: ATP synthase subunit I [Pseudomonadota bacterium]
MTDNRPGNAVAPVQFSRRAVGVILGIQFGLMLLAAGALFLLGHVNAAESALMGGGISVASTLYFALRVFVGTRGLPVDKLVRRFYSAEAQKLVLTVALFAIVIATMEVNFLAMFLTYMVTLVAFWLALLPALTGPEY